VIAVSGVLSFGAVGLLLANAGAYSLAPAVVLGAIGMGAAVWLGRPRIRESRGTARTIGARPGGILLLLRAWATRSPALGALAGAGVGGTVMPTPAGIERIDPHLQPSLLSRRSDNRTLARTLEGPPQWYVPSTLSFYAARVT
jgi:hypothetical protein